MGFVHSIVLRHRTALLFFSGVLSLLTVLFFSLAAIHPERVDAQIPPLSPLMVATLAPQTQIPVVATDTPSPLSPLRTEVVQPSSATGTNLNADSTLQDTPTQQPLAPLGTLSAAQPSLLLVGVLLVGLGLLIFVLLVVRQRE